MDKFVGFFRSVTYLLFLAALLWSYAYMVGQVDYGLGLGYDEPIMDKNTYFFSAVGVFLLVNLTISWCLKNLKKIKTSDSGSGLRNYGFKQDLLVWFKGLGGILNLVLSMIMFFIGLMNIAESRNAMTLGFYVYLGPILLVAWFIYLAIILSKSRTTEI